MGALPYSLLEPGKGRCLREAAMLARSAYRIVRSPPLLTASGHMMVSDLTTWLSTLVSLCCLPSSLLHMNGTRVMLFTPSLVLMLVTQSPPAALSVI